MNNLNEKLIEKYLAGKCSDVEAKQILEWLESSEENRKEWLKFRIIPIKNNYLHLSDPTHIAQSYNELCKDYNKRKRLEQKISRKITLQFMRYAVSILVIIGLSVVFYIYVNNLIQPKMICVVADGNEHVRELILNDSTRVWLSSGSRIVYPERFEKNKRMVSLEGRAYFEVTEDSNRPFYINTETYMVKVLGTAFEINAFKFRRNSDVTLVNGKVEILDNNRTSMCTLQPGQQFKIDKMNNSFSLQSVDAGMLVSWHSGSFEFDGLTFAEITRILEHHYNVRIILDEGIAKDIKLVGSLSFQKDIHQMMKTIEFVVPIKYHVQTDTIVYIHPKAISTDK